MNPDFKSDAVDFVRNHNCANHTPVELIQEAMQYGANKVFNIALDRLKKASDSLDKQRRDSRPHEHKFIPLNNDTSS